MTERPVGSATSRKKTAASPPKWRTLPLFNGQKRTFQNDSLPHNRKTSDGCDDSACKGCGWGYSEIITLGLSACSECKIEEIMDAAERLEAQGINMGAGTYDVWRKSEDKWEHLGRTGIDHERMRAQYDAASNMGAFNEHEGDGVHISRTRASKIDEAHERAVKAFLASLAVR